MSSFNTYKNNLYRDAFLICLVDSFTSIFAGFVIFSVLGFMAKEKGVPVSKVALDGISFVFNFRFYLVNFYGFKFN